jgi:hypothetical protein
MFYYESEEKREIEEIIVKLIIDRKIKTGGLGLIHLTKYNFKKHNHFNLNQY